MLMGITLFGKIKSPIFQFPQSINSLLEVFVSMKRVESFLSQPEINYEKYKKNVFDKNKDYAIKIKNTDFTWGIKQNKSFKENEFNFKLEKEIKNTIISEIDS